MGILYSELEDEVRDGFYVDSLMKCCWKSQLQVLKKVEKICRKYNIQYQAEWGTLLGTVRHGGFIPWDDDLDISMKRQDYEKFIKIAQKELPKGYQVINYHTDKDYWDAMCVISNSGAISMDYDFLEENANFPFSAGLDIFSMDYIPVDKQRAEILKILVKNVENVTTVYRNGGATEEELEQALVQLEEMCHRKIDRNGDLREQLFDLMVYLYTICKEEEAENVAMVSVWAKSENNVYPKEYYAKTTELPFEDSTIQVPIAYDSILKRKYGDYMRMVRKGGSHNYPYYKKQIQILEDNGFKWPRFTYSKRTCRECREEIEQNVDLGTGTLKILEEAHAGIYQMFQIGQLEVVMDILANCQDCVIRMGEDISERIADCNAVIEILEEYCELVYQIYQMIAESELPDADGTFLILQEQITKIKEECSKEYRLKKKIVFVTYKASHWKSLESVWRTAKEDENSIVSVLVVPYFYKRVDGSFIEEHYEKDLFPEYVEIEDYKTFDLKKYHPDVIYINSPYDEYNYLSNIHPAFYSSKLVDMCEKLVYISWFVLSEFGREDERGWQSMQHFVTMPGVVNADKVIVQSEQMKQNYVDYLTDWAGEDTRELWEEKISGFGSPLRDKEENEEEIEKMIPDSWQNSLYKANGEKKKVILYSMSSASFIDYKDKAVDKLKRVLEIFKENRDDLCLLWYWDIAMENTLRENYSGLWKEFCKIANNYQEEAWGIFETEMDKELMARFSDAYYGDGSAVSQAMIMAGKPVMLENFEC